MQISDEDGIRVLREIGAQGIETAFRQRKHLNGGQDWMSEADLDSRYDSIVLSWHLNNGKTVYRNYRTINVSELREQLDPFMKIRAINWECTRCCPYRQTMSQASITKRKRTAAM
ncbi:hypothetical protein [Clostridium sp. AM48-13]|uniref:hypothetical protein n=1 Tax=Clostridium sp. AM48-13 TaxID=2293034 RepID=UPI0011C24051